MRVSGDLYLKLLATFPKFEYSWQSSDCYAFANYIREFCYLEPLPKIDDFYIKHPNEVSDIETLRNDFENLLFSLCYEVFFFQNFDLVYMQFAYTPCLGTVINNKVLFLGTRGAKASNIEDMSKYIQGFFRLEV